MHRFFTGLARAILRPTLIALACLLPQVAPAGMIFWVNGVLSGSDWNYNLMRSELDGSDVATLYTTADSLSSLHATRDHLYWANATTDAIYRANHDGTNITALINSVGSNGSFGGIWTSGTHLYYGLNWVNYKIQKANLDGSGVTTVISGTRPQGEIVGSGSYIYWTPSGVDTIYRINQDGTGQVQVVSNPIGTTELESVAVGGNALYGRTGTATASTLRIWTVQTCPRFSTSSTA